MSKLGSLHIVKNTGLKQTGTVIFFHGSGSNGEQMKEWVRLLLKDFTFPHLKVLYPTAPLQPYTPAGGSMSNVWFDRASITPVAPEIPDSLKKIELLVRNLIKSENDAGIPTNRIVVGGFSMGGALSFHTAYCWEKSVAGMFAFSSFLNDQSAVYDTLKKVNGEPLPPLLQIHGDSDDLVDLEWGEDTYNHLKELGLQGQFHVMERLGHSINKRGLHIIKDWIVKVLPDNA